MHARLAAALVTIALLPSITFAHSHTASAGKLLGTLHLPELPANFAFGDGDGQSLYLTARTGLYRLRLKVSGTRS